MISKIISGGQTGADRGALEAALISKVPHGGYCSRDRKAEDGIIPTKYNLRELTSNTYAARTKQNVRESNVTFIFCDGPLTPGSRRTIDFCVQLGKPWLFFDLRNEPYESFQLISNWLYIFGQDITLNVAGTRESISPGIEKKVKRFLLSLINHLKEDDLI